MVTPRIPAAPSALRTGSDGGEVGGESYGVTGCRGRCLVGCGDGQPTNAQPGVAGRCRGRPELALRSKWLKTLAGSRGRRRAVVRGRAKCSVPSTPGGCYAVAMWVIPDHSQQAE